MDVPSLRSTPAQTREVKNLTKAHDPCIPIDIVLDLTRVPLLVNRH